MLSLWHTSVISASSSAVASDSESWLGASELALNAVDDRPHPLHYLPLPSTLYIDNCKYKNLD